MSKILKFDINGQSLNWRNQCRILKGTSNFFNIQVNPDSMWDGLDLIAVFSSDADPEDAIRLDGKKSCVIPDEAINSDSFSFYIYGYKDELHVRSRSYKIDLS